MKNLIPNPKIRKNQSSNELPTKSMKYRGPFLKSSTTAIRRREILANFRFLSTRRIFPGVSSSCERFNLCQGQREPGQGVEIASVSRRRFSLAHVSRCDSAVKWENLTEKRAVPREMARGRLKNSKFMLLLR